MLEAWPADPSSKLRDGGSRILLRAQGSFSSECLGFRALGFGFRGRI